MKMIDELLESPLLVHEARCACVSDARTIRRGSWDEDCTCRRREFVAYLKEHKAWFTAIMPHLERLLKEDPNVFGIDGRGDDCWPILAEFVTRGRSTLTAAEEGL